jgi:hypothetical protein
MNGTGGHIALRPQFNFLEDGAPVCVLSDSNDCKQHSLLERTQHIYHNAYIVVILLRWSSPSVVGYFGQRRNPVSSVLEVTFSAFTTERVFRLGQNDRADDLMASNLRSQEHSPFQKLIRVGEFYELTA